jgi:hypothetical protein
MKLEKLDSIPDEVDESLFRTRDRVRDGAGAAEGLALTFRDEMESARNGGAKVVCRSGEEGMLEVSAFGILNDLFMYYCPGYRLMVVEGPNEPRRLCVAKEIP